MVREDCPILFSYSIASGGAATLAGEIWRVPGRSELWNSGLTPACVLTQRPEDKILLTFLLSFAQELTLPVTLLIYDLS